MPFFLLGCLYLPVTNLMENYLPSEFVCQMIMSQSMRLDPGSTVTIPTLFLQGGPHLMRMCTASGISMFTSLYGEALSSSEMFWILQNRAQGCLSGLGPACDKISEGSEERGGEGGPVLFWKHPKEREGPIQTLPEIFGDQRDFPFHPCHSHI